MPKVSVVIPSHNRARVVNQSPHQDFYETSQVSLLPACYSDFSSSTAALGSSAACSASGCAAPASKPRFGRRFWARPASEKAMPARRRNYSNGLPTHPTFE